MSTMVHRNKDQRKARSDWYRRHHWRRWSSASSSVGNTVHAQQLLNGRNRLKDAWKIDRAFEFEKSTRCAELLHYKKGL